MTAHLDHVMIGVADLVVARQQLAGFGLHFQPGGRHPAGTSNALLVNGGRHGYVELIAAHDDGDAGEVGDVGMLVRRGGLVAYALSVDDIDAARADLVSAAFVCSPVTAGARVTADGRRVGWRSMTIGAGFGRSELPFLIEWPAMEPHRTGLMPNPHAAYLTEITIGTHDRERLSQLMTVLGLAQVGTGRGVDYRDGEVIMHVIDGPPHLCSVSLARSDGATVRIPAAADGRPFRLDSLTVDERT